jgi:hypothetical protein
MINYNEVSALIFGKDIGVTPYKQNKEKEKKVENKVITDSSTAVNINTTSVTTTNTTTQSSLQKRLDAVRDGAEVKPNPEIVAVWDYKKNMSAMELSSYSPFVAIYVVLKDNAEWLAQLQKKYSRQIKWWKAQIGNSNSTKILVPIAATQSVFETVDFGGGVGISTFDIGYEGTLTQLKGSFNCIIPTLDDFNYDFSAAVLINPVNYYLIFHGWSGPGIFIDGPWNQKAETTWKCDKGESICPGWWAMNNVVSWSRNIMPQGYGYTCDVKFGQIYRGVDIEEDSDKEYNNNQFYTSGVQNYMQGSSDAIFKNINSASDLLAKIKNDGIYQGSNLTSLEEKFNDPTICWFTDLKSFKDKYSIKKTDDNKESVDSYPPELYPIGLALEAIIAEKFVKGQEPIAKIKYDNSPDGTPDYSFTVKSGKKSETHSIAIKNSFSVPINKRAFERILQKSANKTIDHIKQAIALTPGNYQLTLKAISGNETTDEGSYTHKLCWANDKIDKEASKNDLPIEGEDLIFDFRSFNSLITEPQLQASTLGLEQLTNPVVWSKIFPADNMKISGSLKDKDLFITKSKTPTSFSDKDVSKVKLDDNDEWSSEMLIKISDDKLPLRGFLIRSLAQTVQFDIHGTAGMQVMEICWLRGMAAEMNGKHVILSVKDTVTPEGYWTTLKLSNLTQYRMENVADTEISKQEEIDKKKKEEDEVKKKKKEEETKNKDQNKIVEDKKK